MVHNVPFALHKNIWHLALTILHAVHIMNFGCTISFIIQLKCVIHIDVFINNETHRDERTKTFGMIWILIEHTLKNVIKRIKS